MTKKKPLLNKSEVDFLGAAYQALKADRAYNALAAAMNAYVAVFLEKELLITRLLQEANNGRK